jgi:predicted RNase H-like HicB family nuclease
VTVARAALASFFKEKAMLRDYVRGAMHRAHYEILKDDGTYYGEIPGFEGVYANADSLEACREELEEVLEEWVLFRVSRNLEVPEVNGINLQVRKVS